MRTHPQLADHHWHVVRLELWTINLTLLTWWYWIRIQYSPVRGNVPFLKMYSQNPFKCHILLQDLWESEYIAKAFWSLLAGRGTIISYTLLGNRPKTNCLLQRGCRGHIVTGKKKLHQSLSAFSGACLLPPPPPSLTKLYLLLLTLQSQTHIKCFAAGILEATNTLSRSSLF